MLGGAVQRPPRLASWSQWQYTVTAAIVRLLAKRKEDGVEIYIKGPARSVVHACIWIAVILAAATAYQAGVLDHAIEHLNNW